MLQVCVTVCKTIIHTVAGLVGDVASVWIALMTEMPLAADDAVWRLVWRLPISC